MVKSDNKGPVSPFKRETELIWITDSSVCLPGCLKYKHKAQKRIYRSHRVLGLTG